MKLRILKGVLQLEYYFDFHYKKWYIVKYGIDFIIIASLVDFLICGKKHFCTY